MIPARFHLPGHEGVHKEHLFHGVDKWPGGIVPGMPVQLVAIDPGAVFDIQQDLDAVILLSRYQLDHADRNEPAKQ